MKEPASSAKSFPTTRKDWESEEVEQEFALLEECRALMNQERAILGYPAGETSPLQSAWARQKQLHPSFRNIKT